MVITYVAAAIAVALLGLYYRLANLRSSASAIVLVTLVMAALGAILIEAAFLFV